MAGTPSSTSVGGGGTGSGQGSRFSYLSTRLRNRQITMEEATELFAIMQAMIARANETARAAAARVPGAPPSIPGAPAAASGAPGAPSTSDDLFLVGLLAMGAGAGLLAAISKRITEGPPTPPPRTGTSPP